MTAVQPVSDCNTMPSFDRHMKLYNSTSHQWRV